MVSSHNTSLAQKLTDSGLRHTPQRELVYGMLLSQRDHPTAEELFTRVKGATPSISLATIYNCLEALVSCGLVRQVNLERGPSRYCPNLHEHAHLYEKTGLVTDIDLPENLLQQLRALLPSQYQDATIEINFRPRH